MSAQPLRGRGVLAGVVAAAADWLVESAEPAADHEVRAERLDERPVVAVVGLARRSGVTTVARGLGAELAARDPGSACAVTTAGPGGAVPLGLPAAGRLARILEPVGAGRTRACGRLCLVECEDAVSLAGAARDLAPLVLDVADPGLAASAAALADTVLLVGDPSVEPALAAVVAESLARVGPQPIVVLNRSPGDARWECHAHIELPEARVGTQLALAGREPRGPLGRAIEALADRCVAVG